MTPTAELADIVLPKTTSLEEEEVSYQGIGQIVLLHARAVPPRGEARSRDRHRTAAAGPMAARQAITANFVAVANQREFNAFLLGDSGITIAELEAHGLCAAAFELGDFATQPFPDAVGQDRARSFGPGQHGLDPLPGWTDGAHRAMPRPRPRPNIPFELITGDREKQYHHSRFREQAWARKVSPDPRLLMHPATPQRCTALPMATGLWSRRRASRAPARLKLKVYRRDARGVVSTGMGWWRPEVTDAGPRRARRQHQRRACPTRGPTIP